MRPMLTTSRRVQLTPKARQELPQVVLDFVDMMEDDPSQQTPEFDTQWFDMKEAKERLHLELKDAEGVRAGALQDATMMDSAVSCVFRL